MLYYIPVKRKTLMNDSKIVKNLTTGSVTKTMIVFAAPLFFSSLLQTVYALTDMVVVGHYVGQDGLSAVSIGADMLHTLSFVAIGIANAGQVIISQLVGAGEAKRLSKTIGTLLTLLFIAALLFGTVTLIFRREILTLINTPVEAWDHAMSYLCCCASGLIFIFGYNAISAILRGMGDSRHPFYFVAIAAAINIILDLWLVVCCGMGVLGAALATVVSQAVSFIFSVIFLYCHRKDFYFDFRLKSFAVDRQSLEPVVKLGIPMIIQSAAISFSMLFINSMVNKYGVTASALNGVGNKLCMVVNVVNFSLSTAGSSMIGQCVGAGKFNRVPKILKVSLIINSAVSAIMGIAVVMWPRGVFGLFTQDKAVLDLAVTYIPVAIVLFVGSALRPPMFSLINGVGNFKLNLLVALLDGLIVRVGLAFVLGAVCGFGVYGFWHGNALAGIVPFFIGGIYFLTGRWRTQKYLLGRA